jgi:hypothetical protein
MYVWLNLIEDLSKLIDDFVSLLHHSPRREYFLDVALEPGVILFQESHSTSLSHHSICGQLCLLPEISDLNIFRPSPIPALKLKMVLNERFRSTKGIHFLVDHVINFV